MVLLVQIWRCICLCRPSPLSGNKARPKRPPGFRKEMVHCDLVKTLNNFFFITDIFFLSVVVYKDDGNSNMSFFFFFSFRAHVCVIIHVSTSPRMMWTSFFLLVFFLKFVHVYSKLPASGAVAGAAQESKAGH